MSKKVGCRGESSSSPGASSSALDQGVEALAGQEVEALGDRRRVGESGPLRQRPAGHVETLGHALVADQEHLPVELEEDPREGGSLGHESDQVGQQGVALEKRRRLPRQQPGKRLADQRQRIVVGGAVRPASGPPRTTSAVRAARGRTDRRRAATRAVRGRAPRGARTAWRGRRSSRSRSSCAGGSSESPRPEGRRCGSCGSTRLPSPRARPELRTTRRPPRRAAGSGRG